MLHNLIRSQVKLRLRNPDSAFEAKGIFNEKENYEDDGEENCNEEDRNESQEEQQEEVSSVFMT